MGVRTTVDDARPSSDTPLPMPVAGGSITFCRFRAEHVGEAPGDVRRWLSRGLARDSFEPIDRSEDQERSAGWVRFDDHESTQLVPSQFVHGEHVLVTYRVDKLQVPKQPVKAEVETWARTYEKEHGRRPRRSELREQRDLVYARFRNRAFIVRRTYDVTWSLTTDVISVWVSSRRVAEEIQILMEEAFGLSLVPLSPANMAAKLGISPETLPPTPELVGVQISATEATSHVET